MINRRTLIGRMLLWPLVVQMNRLRDLAYGAEVLTGEGESPPSTPRPGFQTQPYLLSRFDRIGRKLAFNAHTRVDWSAWRQEAVRTLRQLTGYDTMTHVPLQPNVTERLDCGDHFRERVEIQTEPGITMPLFVLIPKKGTAPYSSVLALHGHQSRGKAVVVGDRSDPRVAASIRQFNYDYGLQLVREGLMVFAPDARGFGERLEREMPSDSLGGACEYIQKWALPLGQTLAGMWAWDNHRLLDYIQTRPECRRDQIGCAGLSGGGMQTLYASALDERITCAVISGYFVGFKGGLLEVETLFCADNVVPQLYAYMDMGDIAAMIAPRPLLIESGRSDQLYGAGGIQNVIPQMQTVRNAYRLLGAEDKIQHDIFDGGHSWHGVRANPWLKNWLTGL